MKYCIIIPAHNEEAFLGLTLDSVLHQTFLPEKVVVVNDHSTDGTAAILDRYATEHSLIEKLHTTSSTEHIPGSKVVSAFNKGLKEIHCDWGFIVKLDADIILPPDYFEKITTLFKMHSKAGIVGGFAYEKDLNGEWKRNHPMNKNHVRGAFKAYSKACFEAIGGLKNAMGWDTVDELLAQYHGFDIVTEDTLKVKHLRPTGNAYNKKAKLLQGRAMYSMRYGFWISCISSIKMAWKQRKPKVFMHNMDGYFKAAKEKVPFIVSSKEGAYIRRLRWKHIMVKLV